MGSTIKKSWLAILLGLLAVLQLSVLGVRETRQLQGSPSWFEVGDVPSGVRLGGGGDEVKLAAKGPTVLLIFDSSCGHCVEVAPVWRNWIKDHEETWRVVAVSAEPFDEAKAFAQRQGWGVEVGVVASESVSRASQLLTGRTPWVFVIDGNGVILGEGHGSRISEVADRAAERMGTGP